MPTRSARTAWTGGFQDGTGEVELVSSGLGTFEMSFPRRSSEDGGGSTNPEELLAASHSACYSMQLSAMLEERGATVQSIDTDADVTLAADPDGGFMISAIALTVRGRADGIDADGFQEAAQAAKTACPLSKALAAVGTITLEATLQS